MAAPSSIGDAAQIRAIADQVGESAAEIAISQFVSQHPELRQASVTAEIPSPLKWAGMIVTGLFTTGTAALAFWLVSTVSSMQVTLARMDERLAGQNTSQENRVTEIERRVVKLEATNVVAPQNAP